MNDTDNNHSIRYLIWAYIILNVILLSLQISIREEYYNIWDNVVDFFNRILANSIIFLFIAPAIIYGANHGFMSVLRDSYFDSSAMKYADGFMIKISLVSFVVALFAPLLQIEHYQIAIYSLLFSFVFCFAAYLVKKRIIQLVLVGLSMFFLVAMTMHSVVHFQENFVYYNWKTTRDICLYNPSFEDESRYPEWFDHIKHWENYGRPVPDIDDNELEWSLISPVISYLFPGIVLYILFITWLITSKVILHIRRSQSLEEEEEEEEEEKNIQPIYNSYSEDEYNDDQH